MHPLVIVEQAQVPQHLQQFVPIESLIDKAIRALISHRTENGTWTETEQRHYDELTMERVRRMRPVMLSQRLKALRTSRHTPR